MKILITEDDKSLSQGLKTILTTEGYDVDISLDGIDGLNKILSGSYDLVLLDINLPKLDGFSVLNSAIRKKVRTPIILLTARTDIEDKLRGLSSGAVDYITKPFDTRELIARIKLRLGNSHKYKLGNLYLDSDTFSLVCENNTLALTKKEFLIFEQLILKPNKIQHRDYLISKVWGDSEPIDYRTLDVYISMLRKKLKHLEASAIITTRRSVGYVLEGAQDDD